MSIITQPSLFKMPVFSIKLAVLISLVLHLILAVILAEVLYKLSNTKVVPVIKAVLTQSILSQPISKTPKISVAKKNPIHKSQESLSKVTVQKRVHTVAKKIKSRKRLAKRRIIKQRRSTTSSTKKRFLVKRSQIRQHKPTATKQQRYRILSKRRSSIQQRRTTYRPSTKHTIKTNKRIKIAKRTTLGKQRASQKLTITKGPYSPAKATGYFSNPALVYPLSARRTNLQGSVLTKGNSQVVLMQYASSKVAAIVY